FESIIITKFISPAVEATLSQGLASPFLSKELQRAKMTAELLQMMENSVEEGVKGLAVLARELPQLPDGKAALDELKALGAQEEFQLEVSASTLKTLYATVARLMHVKNYGDAADALHFLTLVAPNESLYWLALGHARFNLKREAAALEAYQK